MKTTLNLLLGSLLLVGVASQAAGHNQVRTDDLMGLSGTNLQSAGERTPFSGANGTGKTMAGKNQVQSPRDQLLPKTNLPRTKVKRTVQPEQRAIGETEKNLITRPGW